MCSRQRAKVAARWKCFVSDDVDDATPNCIYMHHNFSAFAKFHDWRWQFPESVCVCVCVEFVATARRRVTPNDDDNIVKYDTCCVCVENKWANCEWVQLPQRDNKMEMKLILNEWAVRRAVVSHCVKDKETLLAATVSQSAHLSRSMHTFGPKYQTIYVDMWRVTRLGCEWAQDCNECIRMTNFVSNLFLKEVFWQPNCLWSRFMCIYITFLAMRDSIGRCTWHKSKIFCNIFDKREKKPTPFLNLWIFHRFGAK